MLNKQLSSPVEKTAHDSRLTIETWPMIQVFATEGRKREIRNYKQTLK